MKIALIIVAGGMGSRMGFTENKLFKSLNSDEENSGENLHNITYKTNNSCTNGIIYGKNNSEDGNLQSILEITLRQFKSFGRISQLIIAHRKDERERIQYIVSNKVGFIEDGNTKISFVVGGETRYLSIHNSLKYIDSSITHVLVHDAVRPFVDISLYNRLINALKEENLVVPTLKSTDTIRVVHDKYSAETLDRDSIHRIQTPQCYTKKIAQDIYNYVEKIPSDSRISKLSDITDDVSLIQKVYPNIKVRCVEGSQYNIKLTVREDLYIARLIYKHLKERGICV